MKLKELFGYTGEGQTIELMQKDDGAGFRFTLATAQPPEQPKLSA